MDSQITFRHVALLITHYNRPYSLKRLLDSFFQQNLFFGQIVVSDDGSQKENLELIKQYQPQYGFDLIEAVKNSGLGNNINKGQHAVTLPYTLYVQEDFVPKPDFAKNLEIGLSYIKEDTSIDLVRYYAYFPYPFTKPYGEKFNRLIFKWYYPGYMKFYQYSDHPHLRRSDFLDKFGHYKEGVNGDSTEYAMCQAFLKKKGNAILFHDINANFDQINDHDEPSTANFRSAWKTGKRPLVRMLRWIYLQWKTVKYHIDYFF